MSKHLVLVGGGHAHLKILLKLADFTRRGHRVTLVSPSPYHYYSGMGPGLLSGIFQPHETRFHIQRMTQERGGTFIENRVIGLDASRQVLYLQSGEQLPFDLVSFNAGSYVTGSSEEHRQWLIPAKPIENLLRARSEILARLPDGLKFVVVGGGPAGVEIAGNLWRLISKQGGQGDITLVASGGILPGMPSRAQELTRASLQRRRIRIIEKERATVAEAGQLSLSGGEPLACDMAFLATGVAPSPIFRHSDAALGEDGSLLVDEHLRSVSHPVLFGGGDCVSLVDHRLPRVGVHAVRQNPVLYHNLLAALEGRPLKNFKPQHKFLLIFNLGDDTAVAVRGGFTGNGSGALHLKNWIDRRFMKRFQVSGEAQHLT